MKIAVLSGKGGTGKTFISTNLAWSIEDSYYIDCDVEEPNGHLFLKPKNIKTKYIKVEIPKVAQELCDGCGECVEFCKFNALAHTGKKLLIFEDVCHSCKGCMLFCPKGALNSKEHIVGKIEEGERRKTKIHTGILDIGEASGTPIIEELVKTIEDKNSVIIDCPPGSACTVMDSIRDVDYCILVLEPTVFGLENFKMVEELVELYNKPYGVIINKYYEKDNIAKEYCNKKDMNILLEIPYDKEIGNYNSNALIISEEKEEYKELFIDLYSRIKEASK